MTQDEQTDNEHTRTEPTASEEAAAEENMEHRVDDGPEIETGAEQEDMAEQGEAGAEQGAAQTRDPRSREEAERLAMIAAEALLDKKGRDVVVLDVGDLTTLADYFVVCHGTSETQIKALADNVEEEIRKQLSEKVWKREGFDSRRWIILDYVNVVVHVFSEEKRNYYGIERMWNDAKRIEVTP